MRKSMQGPADCEVLRNGLAYDRLAVRGLLAEHRTGEVVNLVMAYSSIGASEPEIPVREKTVQQAEYESQWQLRSLFGTVVDLVVAELSGGDWGCNDPT